MNNSTSHAALKLQNISKHFTQGSRTLSVLRDVSLTLNAGEMVGLVGPSGSGKTTLLQIAGLLDLPDEGEIWIEGQAVTRANDEERTRHRLRHLGFVYQFHHLLPEFSAEENVMLPLMLSGVASTNARKEARNLLASLGLAERFTHRPSELSGGEQQRTAIARALAAKPALLLADEPTGNLDPHTAEEVFAMLLSEIRTRRVAALIVTHNPALAERMDRVLTLREGCVVSVA